jgi:hypothetical protein
MYSIYFILLVTHGQLVKSLSGFNTVSYGETLILVPRHALMNGEALTRSSNDCGKSEE